MEIEVRPYEEGDEKQVIEMLENCFPGWPERDLEYSKVDFYQWKYRDNPLGKNISYLMFDNSRVIGSNHGILLNVKVGDSVVITSCGSDLCVHPDYRRKGLTNNMKIERNKAREKYGVYFNYSAAENPIVLGNRVKRGTPIFPHQPTELVWINDVSLHLKMKKSTWAGFKVPAYKLMQSYSKFKNIIHNDLGYDNSFTISEISRFDKTIDSFVEKVIPYYNFMIVRDQKYMNWRYCDLRGGHFYKYQAVGDGGLLGYVVLRINKHDPEYFTGWIVDLLALPGRLDVVSALTDKALEFFVANSVNVVRCWLIKNHEYGSVLSEKGLLDISKVTPEISARPMKEWEGFDKLMKSKPSELHLMIGDTEYL